MLAIRDLSVRFQEGGLARRYFHAIRGLSFTLERGGLLGIAGESGSGKTTILRVLAGLHRGYTGEAKYDGTELKGLSPEGWRSMRRRVQMVFQNPLSSFDPRLPAGLSATLPLRYLKGMKRDAARESVLRMMEPLGLETRLFPSLPHRLSGGEVQRFALLRALAVGPELLLLDEPTSALDAVLKARTIELLKSVKGSHNLSLITISHDMEVVKGLSEEIIVLYKGVLVEGGRTSLAASNPLHPYSRRLIHSDPERLIHFERRGARGISGPPHPELCPLLPECPERMEECTKSMPPLLDVEGRRVRCFIYL